MALTGSVLIDLKDASLPASELALMRSTTPEGHGKIAGLGVYLKNVGLKALSDCSLVVNRLDTYAPEHNQFRDDEHKPSVLISPQRIRAGQTTNGVWIARQLHVKNLAIVIMEGHRGIPVETGNWWLAELHVKARNRVRTETLFFRWEKGKVPEYTEDPRKINRAQA